MGWVSLFDPQPLAALLAMPADAEPVAILCVGPVPEFPDRPALELDGWAFARPLSEFVSENRCAGINRRRGGPRSTAAGAVRLAATTVPRSTPRRKPIDLRDG